MMGKLILDIRYQSLGGSTFPSPYTHTRALYPLCVGPVRLFSLLMFVENRSAGMESSPCAVQNANFNGPFLHFTWRLTTIFPFENTRCTVYTRTIELYVLEH